MAGNLHPSEIIEQQLINSLKENIAEAEEIGQLHPDQLAIIYRERWFNLFVPKEYNGLEYSLPQALQIEEALAWLDGSLGWTVTLCAGANWFIGFLNAELAGEIFSNSEVCLAGSGRPSGIAKMNDNGYEVNGIWKYATGAPHATAFTANCVIEKNGSILQNEDGSPLTKAFLFLRNEVIIHKDWMSIGMIATASHSFEVKQLQVTQQRSFTIDSNRAVLKNPIWQFTFLQFAEVTLAVNSSGMACRYLDLCAEIFTDRKDEKSLRGDAASIRNDLLESTKSKLQDSREILFATVQEAWDQFLNKKHLQPDMLQRISDTSRSLAKTSRKVVDDLYPYCGMIASRPATEINRVWRNLHTASQHSLLLY